MNHLSRDVSQCAGEQEMAQCVIPTRLNASRRIEVPGRLKKALFARHCAPFRTIGGRRNQRTMRMRFCAEVCPETISTLLLGTPKYSDNTRQTSMLALPFSGTACTLTRSIPFSVLPATSLAVERGMTLTLMMNDSRDNLIHQF